MKEEWRPVVGFESHYEVSSLGRVRRSAAGKATKPGRLLKLTKRPSKGRTKRRICVSLSANGTEVTKDVHLIVALAFLGPRLREQEINHLNGDAHDNRAANLEYCTRAENMAHAYRLGLSHQFGVGEDAALAKLTNEQIIVIRSCTAPSRLLARVFGVTHSTIRLVRRGLTWKHVS